MEIWADSEILYSGSVVTLRVGNVTLDNGERAKREVVEHPGGVCVVPFTGRSVILVKQFRIAVGEEVLEVPAGKLEEGEEPMYRGSVELEEETVWDENYEFAQVLLDKIPYPSGHPVHYHIHNLFTVQLYLTALHLELGTGPEWVCGARNLLFMLSRTLPFFFLGTFVSRRMLVGHAVALAALLLGSGSFDNVYPVSAWPPVYSNGMIGSGAALMTVVLLACARYKTGSAFAAAMPAIHMGQTPPVLLFAGLFFLHTLWTRPQAWKQIAIGAAMGGAVVLVSLAAYWHFRVPFDPAPAYTSDVDPDSVWRGYIMYYSDHQQLRVGVDLLCMLWAVLLLAACAWWARGTEHGSVYSWLLVYAAIICGVVCGIMVVHAIMGANTPHALLFWIPYRLPNQIPPLVAAAVALVLLRRNAGSLEPWLLVCGLALSVLGWDQEALLTWLSGAVVVLLGRLLRPGRAALGWAAASAVLWVGLLLFLDQGMRGFWCGLVAGAVVVLVQQILAVMKPPTEPARSYARSPALYFAAAVGILMVLTVFRPGDETQDFIAPDPLEAGVAHLEAAGEMQPDEMLCVPHLQRCLQARLGHPVITDIATLTWIPYKPELGPGMHKLYLELYGINLTPPPGTPYPEPEQQKYPVDPQWMGLWERRTVDEWRALGAEYGFRYVVSPEFVPLQLEAMHTGGGFTIYRIPKHS